MNKVVTIFLFCVCLLCSINQNTFAQSASKSNEELVIALSQDEDYKNFYFENMRFLTLKEADALSEAEEKAFHAEQKERVETIKARYPQYAALSEKEASEVMMKAFALVKKSNK